MPLPVAGEAIGAIAGIILEILPHLLKDDLDKIKAKIEELEKEWKKDEQELLEALKDPVDVAVVSRLFAKYLNR